MLAPGATVEQYDAVNAAMGITQDTPPDGLILHMAGKTDDGVVVIDVWESEEKLNAFFESGLGEALAAEGIDAQTPSISKLHHMIPQGAGTEPTVIVEIGVDAGTDVYDAWPRRCRPMPETARAIRSYVHMAGVNERRVMYIADLWESPEAFGAFAAERDRPGCRATDGRSQSEDHARAQRDLTATRPVAA